MANQPEEDLVLPAQPDEGRYASQEESEKEKTPSEPQGEAANSKEPALDNESSVSELASGESAPEAQHLTEPTASALSSSTQPKVGSSRGSDISTSSASPTRTEGTKEDSPPKNTAEQSEPKSLRQKSPERTPGTSVPFSKEEAANREKAQEDREEAREQAEEQAEEAAEEKKEAREEAKERQKAADERD
jgi:hypothetical protein